MLTIVENAFPKYCSFLSSLRMGLYFLIEEEAFP